MNEEDESRPSSKGKFWKTFAPGIILAAAIVTVVVGVFQVYSFLQEQPDESVPLNDALRASLSLIEYEIPLKYQDELAELFVLRRHSPDTSVFDTLWSAHSKSTIRNDLMFDFSSCLRGKVFNEGDIELQSVILSLPGLTYVNLYRSGSEPKGMRVDGIIDLGTLRPKETIKIVAWCGILLPMHLDSIALTHSLGVGKVQLTKNER